MNIKDRTAIITGGASGLGEATVRKFYDHGAHLAIFDLNRERGEALVAELGDRVSYFEVDVSNAESVRDGISAVRDRFGAIHVCCNYAGIAPAVKTIGRDGPGDPAAFARVIQINLIGTYHVASMAAYAMSENEPVDDDGSRGVIINTASVAAYEGQIGQAAYSASKGGVVSMTFTMARDLARNGIRVNAIAPGLVHTPMFDAFPEEVFESLSKQPLYPKRLAHAAEVAKLAHHIVENNYLNGTTIRLDAGIRMQPR